MAEDAVKSGRCGSSAMAGSGMILEELPAPQLSLECHPAIAGCAVLR